MYELSWYIQNAVFVAFLVETLKRSGGHWLRDNLPQAEAYYPLMVKALALAVSIVACFVVKADGLATLEIYGFHPYVGYAVGGVMLFGGNTLIDAAWDKRKEIVLILEAFKQRSVANG